MSSITPTQVDISPTGDGSVMLVSWLLILQNDTCLPVCWPAHTIKSIQEFGTEDSASMALHGSNDGTNYAALNKQTAGTAIALTAESINQVLEHTPYVKPVVTGGGATQSVNALMVFVRPNPMRQ